MRSLDERFPSELREFFGDLSEMPRSQERVNRSFLDRHQGIPLRDQSFAWALSKSGLPWLELDLKFPFQEMLREAKAVLHRFVAHRDRKDGYDSEGWSAVCLHGISAEKTRDFRAYGYASDEEVPYHWTDVADLCPITTHFFRDVYPCPKYYRLRYVKIAPGGFILPHVDRKESMLWETNFALQNPVGHFFKMEGHGCIPYRDGSAFILDVSRRHAVVNLSDEDRIHMIVHGSPLRTEGWQEMIDRSFEKYLSSLGVP